MGTFTMKEIVDGIFARGGASETGMPDDPPVARVVEYTTPEGQVCWGVVFVGEAGLHRYDRETPYVRNPRVIFPTIESVRAADVAAGGRVCRECGCTDNAACAEGCSWLDVDLCSACEA